MPVYFLHVDRNGQMVVDYEGAEFPNLAAVRSEAIASAREIMSARVARGKRPADGSAFDIRDESGLTVLRMPFQDALVDD